MQPRPCVCGHDIREHEDHHFDIHECTHNGCECQQFRDADEDRRNDINGEAQ
jgi:hypothetical protein